MQKSRFLLTALWCFLSCNDIFCLTPVYIPLTPTNGGVWPKPVTYLANNSFLALRPSHFNFKIERYDCDIIQEAIRRYYHLIFINANSNPDHVGTDRMYDKFQNSNKSFAGFLDTLRIHLMGPCEQFPSEHMDERYELLINNKGFLEPSGILVAQSIWGILRGLETFSQVIVPSNGYKFTISVLSIMDFPQYSHRGLLIDTSRHYLPIKTILRILDAMAYSKLNLLHWHITDDQSFPFQSVSFPFLSEKGSYDKYLAVYTHMDVKRIVDHARLRGIRVIPEFDSPGHTLSWGKGFPSFLTKCGNPAFGEYGPVDPTRDNNYVFLETLFKEVTELFPDNYLHLGGDEVDFECWESNQNILNFMHQHNIATFAELESFYIYKLLNITRKLNTKAVVWQEVFDNKVPIDNNTIIHVWKSDYMRPYEQEMEAVTRSGHHAILSSCWYLDHLESGGDWLKYYKKCDPSSFFGTDAQKRLVLGGEACMWGEAVDETNVQQRIWPRACAAAEILWSGRSFPDGEQRMEEHVCRLKKRGIPAQPPNGPSFCPYFFH